VEKGIEIGVEKGREEKQIEIAKNLRSRGMDIHSVSDITGLPVSQIETL